MELKQLVPWNWFKKEHENETRLPVARRVQANGHHSDRPVVDPFEHLFEGFWRSFGALTPMLADLPRVNGMAGWVKPSVDIEASNAEYAITVELPGVDESHVDVEVLDDTLVIKGRKENVKEERTAEYCLTERSYGAFQRQLSLPEDADPEAITASFKQGVLTIKVPRKVTPERRPRRIPVRPANSGA